MSKIENRNLGGGYQQDLLDNFSKINKGLALVAYKDGKRIKT